jgi:hypothetical protein
MEGEVPFFLHGCYFVDAPWGTIFSYGRKEFRSFQFRARSGILEKKVYENGHSARVIIPCRMMARTNVGRPTFVTEKARIVTKLRRPNFSNNRSHRKTDDP